MSHDAVLVFSKTWGAIYLMVVFLASVVWTFWPSRREMYEKAAHTPLMSEEDGPCR